jgi:DNA-binding transcriptional regulator YdaS (Cro superfamily)
MTTEGSALERAKSAVGGDAALAKMLGIKPQAVQQWKRAPVGRVLNIERITGVSRHLLRPDIYPVDNREAAE